MKSIVWIVALVLYMLSLVSCMQKAESPKGVGPKAAPSLAPASAPSQTARQQTVQGEQQTTDTAKQDVKMDAGRRKIIKEGELDFETSDIGKTRALITKSVNDIRGYVAQESQDRYDDRLTTRMVIRVPAESFDKLVETLSASADVIDRKNIKVLDVTEEYIDLETRLKTRKELENRYRQLLGQAKKVTDVLEIEKQIGEVREKIESAEGRLKYLNDRIAFSTLTVVYYEKVGSSIGFISKFKAGVRNGWTNFALFVVVLVNIWPFLILSVIVIVIFIRIRRRLRSRKDR
jgi:hypothetical protein